MVFESDEYRILVIDDEFKGHHSYATKQLMQKDAHAVDKRICLYFASSAEEGIAEYHDLRPKIVVTDINMETEDAGLVVINTIRREDKITPIYINSFTENKDILAKIQNLEKQGMVSGWVNKVLLIENIENLVKHHPID